jgi:hypothetical protein
MKSIQIDQKTVLIRRWGRWYRVTRGGLKWSRVFPLQRNVPQPVVEKGSDADVIDRAAQSLAQSYPPGTDVAPPIQLDK